MQPCRFLLLFRAAANREGACAAFLMGRRTPFCAADGLRGPGLLLAGTGPLARPHQWAQPDTTRSRSLRVLYFLPDSCGVVCVCGPNSAVGEPSCSGEGQTDKVAPSG